MRKYEIIKSILLKIKEVENRNNLIIISSIFEHNDEIILVIENQNIIHLSQLSKYQKRITQNYWFIKKKEKIIQLME